MDDSELDINIVSEQIYSYFPDCKMKDITSSFETEDGSKILVGSQKILAYLQTILFEEHLVEVQLDFTTRMFYANLLDDTPSNIVENAAGDVILEESEYEAGSYLRSFKDIVLTALTPGMGNVKIQNSSQVIIRFFAGTSAIELGSKYIGRDTVEGAPVLRLAYPEIGRVNNSYRPFRVKAVSTVAAQVCVNDEREENGDRKFHQVVDISAMGMAFDFSDEPPYSIGEVVTLEIKVPDINNLKLNANIRHISKVRAKKGYSHICGAQFDLETRSVAADIEQLVAAIQRLQLREIYDKTSNLNGVSLIK